MTKFEGDVQWAPRTWELPDLTPNGRPLREQVADAVRSAIADGTFRPGQQVPGQHAIARRYGVSFYAVSRAFDLLTDEGVLRNAHHRGHFVARRPERT